MTTRNGVGPVDVPSQGEEFSISAKGRRPSLASCDVCCTSTKTEGLRPSLLGLPLAQYSAVCKVASQCWPTGPCRAVLQGACRGVKQFFLPGSTLAKSYLVPKAVAESSGSADPDATPPLQDNLMQRYIEGPRLALILIIRTKQPCCPQEISTLVTYATSRSTLKYSDKTFATYV